MDFQVYYDAATRAAQRDADLFELRSENRGLAYRYAPVIAVLLIPFTLLPLQVAAFVWYLLKVAALAKTVSIARQLSNAQSVALSRVFLAGLLLSGPFVIEDLATGNMHSLAIFAVVVACHGIARGRVLVPSIALALAILAKLTPAVALLYLVARREWRALAGVGVTLIVLCAAPTFYTGIDVNAGWLRDWKQTALARIDANPNEHDASLKGALIRYFSATDAPPTNFPSVKVIGLPRSVVVGAWLVVGAVALSCLLLTAFVSNKQSDRRVYEYGLLLVTILVVSPHSTRLYYCALFFPYLLLTIRAVRTEDSHSRWLRGLLWMSFAINSVLPFVVPGRKASLAYEAAAPFVFSTLAAWVALYWLTTSRSRETTF